MIFSPQGAARQGAVLTCSFLPGALLWVGRDGIRRRSAQRSTQVVHDRWQAYGAKFLLLLVVLVLLVFALAW